MLRDDPKTQGRRLFVQHCASCHTHFDPDAPDALAQHQDELEQATAPNLYGFASRDWLKGLLNPKQINGPLYFGNTSHRKADMADFVTERLSDPKLWKPEEIEQVIAGLSAEADLPAQRALDHGEQAKIKRGASALERFRPLRECHRFHDANADATDAPDLTGYGSKDWLTAMIGDPAHERFYGKKNDRMPAFAKRLTPKEIGFLAEWLRGETDIPAEKK